MKKRITLFITTIAVICVSAMSASAIDFKAIDPDRVGNATNKLFEIIDNATVEEMSTAACETVICNNGKRDLMSFDKTFHFANETEYYDYDFTIDPALGSKAVVLNNIDWMSVSYWDSANTPGKAENYIAVAPDGYDQSNAKEGYENVAKGTTFTLNKYGYYFFTIFVDEDSEEAVYITVRLDDPEYIEHMCTERYRNYVFESYEAYLNGNTTVDEPVVAPPTTTMAESKSQNLTIAGKTNSLEAFNIADNNYFKLRDICCALTDMDYNIEVTWDGERNAINLIKNKPYTRVGGEYKQSDFMMHEANLSNATVYLDGEQIDMKAYNINGNNFFKLRDLCRALNIYINWNSQRQIIEIDPSNTYVEN